MRRWDTVSNYFRWGKKVQWKNLKTETRLAIKHMGYHHFRAVHFHFSLDNVLYLDNFLT